MKAQKKLLPNPVFVVGAKIVANYPVLWLVDPFVVPLLTSVLHENLHRWLQRGLLTGYRFKVERLGRLTYRLELHVSVSKEESKKMVMDYIRQLLGPAFRDFV